MSVEYFAATERILLLCIVVSVIVFIAAVKRNNQIAADLAAKLPYRKRPLLTENEYSVYKILKETADKYGCTVSAKVRFTDLVEVSDEADKGEYKYFFERIKSEYIDFMLCKKENLYPELLIEVNDNPPDTEKRIKRDDFIKKTAEKTGYKIIFVNGAQNLEETVIKAMETANNNDPPVAEKA